MRLKGLHKGVLGFALATTLVSWPYSGFLEDLQFECLHAKLQGSRIRPRINSHLSLCVQNLTQLNLKERTKDGGLNKKSPAIGSRQGICWVDFGE